MDIVKFWNGDYPRQRVNSSIVPSVRLRAGCYIGRLHDFSSNGLQISLPSRFLRGDTIELEVSFHKRRGLFRKSKPLRFRIKVEVVWSKWQDEECLLGCKIDRKEDARTATILNCLLSTYNYLDTAV